jgi:hypothetical protein
MIWADACLGAPGVFVLFVSLASLSVGTCCVFVIKIPFRTNAFPGNDRYGWGHVFEKAQMHWFLVIIRSFIRF